MILPRLQNRPRSHIEHLHGTRIVTGSHHASVGTDIRTSHIIIETVDCSEELSGADGVNLHAGTGGHSEDVRGLGERRECSGG